MPRVFRPKYTKSIPSGTLIIERDGVRGAWVEVAGATKFGTLGRRPGTVTIEVDEWYIEYSDAAGKQRRQKATTDRAEAERLLAEAVSRSIVQRVSLSAMGVTKAALLRQVSRSRSRCGVEQIEGILTIDLSLLPCLSAVYFLVDRGEVVYVGQSVNFLRRVLKHMEKKVFDRAFYVPTPMADLVATEKKYIRRFRPKYNRDERGVLRFGWAGRKPRAKEERCAITARYSQGSKQSDLTGDGEGI